MTRLGGCTPPPGFVFNSAKDKLPESFDLSLTLPLDGRSSFYNHANPLGFRDHQELLFLAPGNWDIVYETQFSPYVSDIGGYPPWQFDIEVGWIESFYTNPLSAGYQFNYWSDRFTLIYGTGYPNPIDPSVIQFSPASYHASDFIGAQEIQPGSCRASISTTPVPLALFLSSRAVTDGAVNAALAAGTPANITFHAYGRRTG